MLGMKVYNQHRILIHVLMPIGAHNLLDNHGDNIVTMYTHMREEIRES
jgi:hypothetical protein